MEGLVRAAGGVVRQGSKILLVHRPRYNDWTFPKGKADGTKVVFGSKVDLGKEDGGVFNWTGHADDKEFIGQYEGGGDKGTFKMAKK